MKLRWITLVIAVAMAVAMPIAASPKGWHSTAGIWAALLNLPGSAAGVWVGELIDNSSFVFCVAAAAVNWAFYFWIAKGIIFLKRKLFRKNPPAPPTHITA